MQCHDSPALEGLELREVRPPQRAYLTIPPKLKVRMPAHTKHRGRYVEFAFPRERTEYTVEVPAGQRQALHLRPGLRMSSSSHKNVVGNSGGEKPVRANCACTSRACREQPADGQEQIALRAGFAALIWGTDSGKSVPQISSQIRSPKSSSQSCETAAAAARRPRRRRRRQRRRCTCPDWPAGTRADEPRGLRSTSAHSPNISPTPRRSCTASVSAVRS